MRIGFFGHGKWAVNSLEYIINDNNFQVLFVVTRFKDADFELIKLAKSNDIPVLEIPDVNSVDATNIIYNFRLDLIVSMSYDLIFKSNTLKLPYLGAINCHAGKLPFYRGRNILNWVLINDEKEFGITVHYIDSGIDTGDIILQNTYPISNTDTYATLLNTAYTECAKMLYESLKLIINDKVNRIPQSSINPIGSYCGKRQSGDEIINWYSTSKDIYNFVRALTAPGPYATSYINKDPFKIVSTIRFDNLIDYKGIPGQVIAKVDNLFLVKTLDNFIGIKKYLSTKKIKIGDRFK
jgi:methionyl-tRNA formyltransferase